MGNFLFGDRLDNAEVDKRLQDATYLKGHKPSETERKNILLTFWFHDNYISFISTDPVLHTLNGFLNSIKPEDFNRYNFYKYFFDQISTDKDYRQALRKFALAFEQLQTDNLSPEDFLKLLTQLKLNKIIHSEWLEKKNLVKSGKRDDKEIYYWLHHTLTEFLTAELFVSEKNTVEQFINNGVIDQESVIALKPSWHGVLRFLLESSKSNEVFEWLISFLKQNIDNLDDNLAEILVYTDTEELNSKHTEIFNLIYETYSNRILWIPSWARVRLAHYVGEKEYTKLKKDLNKTDSVTETFVKRGNAISIVQGLFEFKSSLLTQKEQEFWKTTLLTYVNNPEDDGNGVLQRHSLDILAYFHDEHIIPQIEVDLINSPDSLVRDAFLDYCAESTPNSPHAIDNFIEGIKQGSSIYARHGLYNINSYQGIKYFLESISHDKLFIQEFLEHESIFDKETGDIQLRKNIEIVANAHQDLLPILKQIIKTTFESADIYNEEKSPFIRSLVNIIGRLDTDYLWEILQELQTNKEENNSSHLFYDYEEVIALLLNPDNVENYMMNAPAFPENICQRFDSPIYIARRINADIGQRTYEKAIEQKLIPPPSEPPINWEEQDKKKEELQIQEFEKLLEPKPGKYSTEVFGYYRKNFDLINKYFETEKGKTSKEKLFWLSVTIGINKIDPRKFTVTLDKKSPNHFTWTSTAAYYDDLVWTARALDPDSVIRNRQHIIDFIPYSFSDAISFILELSPKVTDQDLDYVNKAMADKENNLRYLIPGSYISAVKQFAENGSSLSSAKDILISLVNDPDIQDYERRHALETLKYFTNTNDSKVKKLLLDLLKSEDSVYKTLADDLLIAIFNDNEAIQRRIDKLKEPLSFNRNSIIGIAHSVSAIENELSDLNLAKPLIELKDTKYLPVFFDLLEYSFKFPSKDDKNYWEYTTYLWRIVVDYVDSLKINGSFEPLLSLETYIAQHLSKVKNSNWLMTKVKELRKDYINSIGQKNLEDII